MEWLQLILLIISVISGVINVFLAGYLNRKGANYADKQDIREITKTVEEVKSEFGHKTELLRAEIGVLAAMRLEYKKAERVALTDFHNKFLNWYHDLNTEDNQDPYGKKSEQAGKLRVRKNNLLISFQEFSKAFHSLLFIVKDQKVLDTAHGLYKVAQSLQEVEREMARYFIDNYENKHTSQNDDSMPLRYVLSDEDLAKKINEIIVKKEELFDKKTSAHSLFLTSARVYLIPKDGSNLRSHTVA